MAKKLLLLLLALALLLSSCSYQVVEDSDVRTILGVGQSAYALEEGAGEDGGERTLTGDIANILRWIGEQLRKFAQWAANSGDGAVPPQAEGSPSFQETPAPTPEPTPAPTPLADGARGDEVKIIQQRLREWGFMTDSADGIFGANTENGVKELQNYLHELGELGATSEEWLLPTIEREETAEEEFVADGVVSEELKEILLGVGQFALYREDLSRGSEGPEVRRLQTRLNNLDYLTAGIDGQFGPRTADAISYFQKRNGLEQTGVADLDTQMLLFSSEAVKSDRPEYPYYIKVSIADQRVYAYAWENGSYSRLVRTMKCSTGLPETPTPTGTYSMAGQAGRWYYFSKFECWAQYAYRIYGPYLFHSVLYSEKDTSTLRQGSVDNLGSPASHGCIRLSVEDAKWLYNNCAAGTTVKIY